MSRRAKSIPEGLYSVTPYLMVKGADKVIEFLENVFEASIVEQLKGENGLIMHAQVRLGDSIIMLGEAPAQYGPMPGSLYVYVDDTDQIYKRALEAGASSLMEPADQFYGDRCAAVGARVGDIWWWATHEEDA